MKNTVSPHQHCVSSYENYSDYPCTGEPPERSTALVVTANPAATADLKRGAQIAVKLHRQQIDAVDFYSLAGEPE